MHTLCLILSALLLTTAMFPTVLWADGRRGTATVQKKTTALPVLANVPTPVSFLTDTGSHVFLLQDPEIPIIEGTIWIRSGMLSDPVHKAGLTDLLGRVWAKSGTQEESKEAFQRKLGLAGAQITTAVTEEYISFSFRLPKENWKASLAHAWALFTKPHFSADQVEPEKQNMKSEWAHRTDRSDKFVAQQAGILALGRKHPRYRQRTEAGIESMTLADLTAWHQQYVRAPSLFIGIRGDFVTAEMQKELSHRLSGINP